MEKVISYIDGLESLAIELETGLCKFPAISPENGGEGEIDKCLFLESWLKAQGITKLERYDAPDPRAKAGIRPNLIATIEGLSPADQKAPMDSGCFWIMSHIDVVPPGEMSLWISDPWNAVVTVEDGKKRITGRGVEDNQQGLVSSVLAALALVRQGIKPPRTVKLLFVSDEENGSEFGIGWMMKNHPSLFRPGDTALVPDSGDAQGASVEVAEKNIIWARFATHGKQAHGSRPDQGINAHLAAADLAVELHYGLSKKFGARDPLFDPDYSTFQPTKKEVNVPNVNTIPGEDALCFDMRVLPQYPIKTVLEEVDRVIAGIQAKHKVTIDYTLSQAMESKPTSPEVPLVKKLAAHIKTVYGVTAKPVGIGGGTLAAYMRNRGIDSVVWSRISEGAHQPNESVMVEHILGDARIMALMMLDGA